MENWLGGISNIDSIYQHGLVPIPQPEEKDDPHIIMSGQSITPFHGTPDQMGYQEWLADTDTDMDIDTIKIVEPKLLHLLEFFRQLSFRRRDVFKSIIHVHREKLENIFNKVKMEQEEEKDEEARKMRRVIRQRSMSFGNVDEVRLKRFKVKPIDSGGTTPPTGGGGTGAGGSGAGGGAGGTKPSTSK